ncbi:MAG TPA: hypothetical protein VG650_18100 [Mycobacteriales bacterium]|nr:hypothetical protein [Mycobacteriales bacterium]
MPVAAATGTVRDKRIIDFIAGDDHYLVYLTDHYTVGGQYEPTQNLVEVDRRLGHRVIGHDDEQVGGLDYSLDGSTLLGRARSGFPGNDQHAPNDASRIYWWDLAKHTSGSFELAANEVFIGAARGAAVYQTVDPQSATPGEPTGLFRRTMQGGAVTQLPLSYPHATTPREIATGPAGYLVRLAQTGRATYFKYGASRGVKLHLPASFTISDGGRPLARYAAFGEGGEDDGITARTAFVPLDGGATFVIGSHGPFGDLGQALVYGHKHVHFRTKAGKVHVSGVHGSVAGAAFGGAVIHQAPTSLAVQRGWRATPVVIVK